MQPPRFLKSIAGACLVALSGIGFALASCATAADTGTASKVIPRLVKSKAEWRRVLPPERYQILFEDGTERVSTSPLNNEKRAGVYVCAACNLPLFESTTKFESGTGWPSFSAPIPGRLETKHDYRLFTPRTEYHCVRCAGHQGHVFDDGPPPTGQRWCNNGLALLFVPTGEPLPALRE